MHAMPYLTSLLYYQQPRSILLTLPVDTKAAAVDTPTYHRKKQQHPTPILQTTVSTGAVGQETTPAITQEAVVVNQLLYKEPLWKTLNVIKSGVIWGSLLGAVLQPSIGLLGFKVKQQCIETSLIWRKEAQQTSNQALLFTSNILRWLGENMPHVNSSNLQSWGKATLKGGVMGGLLGITLTLGTITELKEGLNQFQATAQGNTNVLKAATWAHKFKALFDKIVPPPEGKTQRIVQTEAEREETQYATWRNHAFSKSQTLKTMLASGLLYSLLTLSINALGSRFLLNKVKNSNMPLSQAVKSLEHLLDRTILLEEKHPVMKYFRSLVNGLPTVENGQFQLKTIIETVAPRFSKWLRIAFKKNTAPKTNPTKDQTAKLVAYLEKSQDAVFFQAILTRYHPITLFQILVIASMSSVLVTAQNKRLIKQLEQQVHKQLVYLPTKLDERIAEDKQRISNIKTQKKAVSDLHF